MDWFGYKPSEMMGSSITSVLTEAKVLEEVLAGSWAAATLGQNDLHMIFARSSQLRSYFLTTLTEVKNSSLSGDRTGSIHVDMDDVATTIEYKVSSGDVIISGRYVRHKYADPVQVGIPKFLLGEVVDLCVERHMHECSYGWTPMEVHVHVIGDPDFVCSSDNLKRPVFMEQFVYAAKLYLAF